MTLRGIAKQIIRYGWESACGRLTDTVFAYWWRGKNWGDQLNPYLIRLISGRSVCWTQNPKRDTFICVGSIVALADFRTTIWGAGFCLPEQRVSAKPSCVCAVRGPLTRRKLIEQGVDTPEIYGDPALLLPLFYSPAVCRTHRVGVVPHYADKGNPWIERLRQDPAVKVIDVQGELLEFVREIRSCDLIASSSLHGLICADAYGVPSVWVEFSDRVRGNGFKFRDYFLAVGQDRGDPVHLTDGFDLAHIERSAWVGGISFLPGELLNTCPFKQSALTLFLREQGDKVLADGALSQFSRLPPDFKPRGSS